MTKHVHITKRVWPKLYKQLHVYDQTCMTLRVHMTKRQSPNGYGQNCIYEQTCKYISLLRER